MIGGVDVKISDIILMFDYCLVQRFRVYSWRVGSGLIGTGHPSPSSGNFKRE